MSNILWTISRHALVSLIVMLLTLSLSTGQFPPPISATFRSLKELKGLMNVNRSATKIAEARKEQEQILNEINQVDKEGVTPGSPGQPSAPSRAPASVTEATQSADRIKSLEYEVALLRSKLNRAEWEAEQLRNQVAGTSLKQ